MKMKNMKPRLVQIRSLGRIRNRSSTGVDSFHEDVHATFTRVRGRAGPREANQTDRHFDRAGAYRFCVGAAQKLLVLVVARHRRVGLRRHRPFALVRLDVMTKRHGGEHRRVLYGINKKPRQYNCPYKKD